MCDDYCGLYANNVVLQFVFVLFFSLSPFLKNATPGNLNVMVAASLPPGGVVVILTVKI